MKLAKDLPQEVDVVVIGGGIGGLCAALALTRVGLEVLLIERAPRFEPVGAGIVLAANATAALAALNVDATSFGAPLTSMDILHANGSLLSRLPVSRLRAEVGPVFACHRAELHGALERALSAKVSTALGMTVTALAQTDDGATVTIADAQGEAKDVGAKLVIGADGLRSAVRALIGQDAPLRYSGETCWRAIVRGVSTTTATESWGARTRVGVVPSRPTRAARHACTRSGRRTPKLEPPRDRSTRSSRASLDSEAWQGP